MAKSKYEPKIIQEMMDRYSCQPVELSNSYIVPGLYWLVGVVAEPVHGLVYSPSLSKEPIIAFIGLRMTLEKFREEHPNAVLYPIPYPKIDLGGGDLECGGNQSSNEVIEAESVEDRES